MLVNCSCDQVPLWGTCFKTHKANASSVSSTGDTRISTGHRFQEFGIFPYPLRMACIKSMFHVLCSHDPVFKQAATLILLSSNVISFSEVSTTVPILRKSNNFYLYIYVCVYIFKNIKNIPGYPGYRYYPN